MMTFWQDLRYAVRTLRRVPGLVTTAVLSLALGIAATTAVFSFVNALQFKALPFADENSLVDIEETSVTDLCAGCSVGTSYATLQDWQARASSFSAIGAYAEMRMIVGGTGEPERISAARVSASLFPMLGVRPALGRGIAEDDDRVGADTTVLLSDKLWRRRFGGDPAALGQLLKINGVAHTVIGVMPPGFQFPEFAQLWTPLAPGASGQARSARAIGVIGRLKAGVDVRQADAEMKAVAAGVAAAHPETNARWSARVRSLREAMTGETVAPSIVLLGAVTFVLLIACANVSNLLLVRAAERKREISIRLAIGASRRGIVGLVLAESLALGAAGGILGLVLALWANRLIVSSFGIDAPYWIQFGIDWHVFGFCAAITIGTAILFGLAPALQASVYEPQAALKEGGGTTGGRRGRRVASALVMAQLALALSLLAGAGLLIKTVVRSVHFDPGFNAAQVLEGDVSLPAIKYATPASIDLFVKGVLEQLARVPDARAGVQSFIFFRGFGAQSRRVTVEGLSKVPEDASPSFYFSVTPDYFRMLGTAMRQGREFTDRDRDEVVIVNEEMAQRLWPGGPALGRRLRFGDKPWRTVIGVVGNVNGGIIGARQNPLAYVPFSSEPVNDIALMISTDRDPATLAPEMRAAVRAVDPDQPIEDIMTMAAAFHEQVAPSRFVALLMTGLSVVALALASVGLYGVTAYGVRRRLREIGIRMALGGTAHDVVRLILGSAWRVIAPGLALGIAGAWVATRALEGVLFGTSPTDPTVFTAVVVTLALVASAASYLPARRAARVDPVQVLRQP